MKKKIFVGVSGGVDSSVAAYLLKQAGYEVHGIFVKTWSPEWLPCTWVDEKRDAMRVCAYLDIPFHFLDAEAAYRDGVAEYLIEEYKRGRTPNPDVLCNRLIKFGVMWEYARERGADAIATGHYARIAPDGTLVRGADPAKDQSYFLWMLTASDLAHTMFPIGAMPKRDVRAIAARAGLPTATKKDSQGICFLGPVDMRDFLSHYITQSVGRVVNDAGEVIGEHDGAVFYTVGERHGFRIRATVPNERPYYVTGKDLATNTLVVSHERTGASDEGCVVSLRSPNWLAAKESISSATAQIRYHGEHIPCTVIDESTVRLARALPIPLGQSLVVYDGDTLVGGGIIDKVSSV